MTDEEVKAIVDLELKSGQSVQINLMEGTLRDLFDMLSCEVSIKIYCNKITAEVTLKA